MSLHHVSLCKPCSTVAQMMQAPCSLGQSSAADQIGLAVGQWLRSGLGQSSAADQIGLAMGQWLRSGLNLCRDLPEWQLGSSARGP